MFFDQNDYSRGYCWTGIAWKPGVYTILGGPVLKRTKTGFREEKKKRLITDIFFRYQTELVLFSRFSTVLSNIHFDWYFDTEYFLFVIVVYGNFTNELSIVVFINRS